MDFQPPETTRATPRVRPVAPVCKPMLGPARSWSCSTTSSGPSRRSSNLVEYVANLFRDAPLVLLCMAWPELLNARPGWSGGKLNATSILLQPLQAAESSELIANLLSRAAVLPALETQIAGATEGNPLFAEELLTELIDDGLLRPDENRWMAAEQLVDLPIPPPIHALLAARLERLPDDERALLTIVSAG